MPKESQNYNPSVNMGVHYYVKITTQDSGKRKINFWMKGGEKIFTSLLLIWTIYVSNLNKRLKVNMLQLCYESASVCISVIGSILKHGLYSNATPALCIVPLEEFGRHPGRKFLYGAIMSGLAQFIQEKTGSWHSSAKTGQDHQTEQHHGPRKGFLL